jgi:flavorubredoxin
LFAHISKVAIIYQATYKESLAMYETIIAYKRAQNMFGKNHNLHIYPMREVLSLFVNVNLARVAMATRTKIIAPRVR